MSDLFRILMSEANGRVSMSYNPGTTDSDSPGEEDWLSLVERIFDDPDAVGQGEYTAIYEFLLVPDICDDPDAIAGVLQEFSGWAQHMFEQMRKLGLGKPISST
ncbi:MAG: hypothetical protein SWK90_05295 [Chloroflexota bacterium]|nr:hypothetical protein [Chloroflexota bacterium]